MNRILLMKKTMRVTKFIGLTILTVIIIFLALVFFPLKTIGFPLKDYEVLIIENVSIIDVEKNRIHHRQNVMIRGNQIEAISSDVFNQNSVGKQKVKVINGADHYLVPALWDMHVHLTKRSPHNAYPSFVGNGITHVRDMRGAHDDRDPFAGVQTRLQAWNKQVERQELVGPRLHGYTSLAVEGPHKMFNGKPSFFNCATPADAIQLVRYLKESGVTLIKIYNHIPRDAFFSLMKEAAIARMEVAGHKPYRVSTIEASDAGMKSLEHAKFFIWDSYSGADSLRSHNLFKEDAALRKDILRRQDSNALHAMFRAFQKNKTWYCPTHLTRKQDAFAGDETFRSRYKGINPILRFLAFEDLDATLQEKDTTEAREGYMDVYKKGLEISGAAYRNGIKMLAGSDTPELPGTSLHEELIELSKAGLSNFEVLRTATWYPAQYYGLENVYGSIGQGKRADFLLLSKNPIDAIENAQSIRAVVTDGHYLDEAFLQKMKQNAAERGNSLTMSAKLIWDMLVYMTL